MNDDLLYMPDAIDVLRRVWPDGAELALFMNKVWQEGQSARKPDAEKTNG